MPAYNPRLYPYPSRRAVHYAKNGMACSTHPAVSAAGLSILQTGGNAIDAAVAMAAALTVAEPGANGIGGDCFALVWHKGQLYGLNSSGYSPRNLDYETFARRGEVPLYGWDAVTVPGAPAGWAALSERFSRLPFARLMEPAVRMAEDGHALSADVAAGIQGRRVMVAGRALSFSLNFSRASLSDHAARAHRVSS